MKTKTLLIAAVILLCFSAASFAQQIYSTSSTPITTVIATGNAELVGNITFTGNPGPSVAGTIYLQYGGSNVNITSTFASITVCTNNVGFVAAPGVCAAGFGTYAGLQVDLVASTYSPGLLVIDVPAGLTVAAGAAPTQLTIGAVRVQINGTGLTNLIANISGTGNLIAAGSTAVTVINSTTGVGIASATSYLTSPPLNFSGTVTAGTPVVNAVTGAVTCNGIPCAGNATIAIKEGFLAAFTKGVGVRITVSATPAKGVTFTFPATATSYDAGGGVIDANWVRGVSTSQAATGTTYAISSSTTSTSSLQVYYYVATDTAADPTTIEYLEIPVTIASDPTVETFPLPAGSFSYTVSLAPVQGPYNTSGANTGKPDGLLVPRFQALETPTTGIPIVTVAGSSTTMLIPYGYASKTAGDFNTAMAIINSSEDPGTTLLGFTGAVPQAGPITFYLFPQDSTLPMFTYKTVAGSPGSGLDASGNVLAGGTYTVFLNQIFPLATPPTGSTAVLGNSFTGYVMIVTNFTNAHGIFVISNFTTLTAQSSLMLVLGDRSVLPERAGF
jgi:hypothetical protein